MSELVREGSERVSELVREVSERVSDWESTGVRELCCSLMATLFGLFNDLLIGCCLMDRLFGLSTDLWIGCQMDYLICFSSHAPPVYFFIHLYVFIAYFVQSPRDHLHVVRMFRFMSDVNQPSLPTPFYSVLLSLSLFMASSTVFHSTNSPDNSPLSHSDLPVLFLPYWSFQLHISLWKSPSALI